MASDLSPITSLPFDARQLPSVLDRHVKPITVTTDEGFTVDGISYAQVIGSTVHLLDYASNVRGSVDGGEMVEVVNGVLLDAPSDVIAYTTRDGERLCADHGAAMDDGTEDNVSPVFTFSGSDLDRVEYCGHHDADGHGHSFCGCCGSHIDTHGNETDVAGPFCRCWNCSATSVYVDGNGFEHVNGFDSALDTHKVTVEGITAYCQTNLDGTTTVDAINADMAPTGTMRHLQAFAAWCEADPSSGLLLILAESSDEADEVAMEWTEEGLDASDAADEVEAEEMLSDRHADTRVARIALDKVTVTSKR